MSTQLGDLLIKLSQDPILSERYKDDPSRLVSDFNLNPEEGDLLHGDMDSFHTYFKANGSKVGKTGTGKKKKAKKKKQKN